MDPNIRRKFIPKVKNKLVVPISTIENVEIDDPPNFTPQITKNSYVNDVDGVMLDSTLCAKNLDVNVMNDAAAIIIDAKISNNLRDESSNSVVSETIITSAAKPIICIAAAGSKSRPKPIISQLYKVVITDNTVDSNYSVSNEQNTCTSTTATTISIENEVSNDFRLKNRQKYNDKNNKIDDSNIAKGTKTKIVKIKNKEKNNDESQENQKKTVKVKKNEGTGLRRKRAINAVLMFIDTWIESKSIEIIEKNSVNKCNNNKRSGDISNEKRNSKKVKTNKFEKSSVLPLSFGATTPYTVFSKFVLKRPEGIGLRIKVIDGKAVIRGFHDHILPDFKNALQVDDVLYKVGELDSTKVPLDKLIAPIKEMESMSQESVHESNTLCLHFVRPIFAEA